MQWFQGINSVLGVDRTGIYGGSRQCAWAIGDGVIGRSNASSVGMADEGMVAR